MQRDIWAQMARQGKPITSRVLMPQEGAHARVLTIEQLKPGENGKFLTLNGTKIPW